MLTKEQAEVLLQIISQTKFAGSDVETVADLKATLQAIIAGEKQ